MKILILDSITLGDDISLDKLKELGEVITYPQSSREEKTVNMVDADLL